VSFAILLSVVILHLQWLEWIFILHASADVISASIMLLNFCQLLFGAGAR